MSGRVVTVEDTITKLLAEKKYSTLKDVLTTMNGADFAAVFHRAGARNAPASFSSAAKRYRFRTAVLTAVRIRTAVVALMVWG